MITNAGSQKFDLFSVGKVDQRVPRGFKDDLGSINPGLGEKHIYTYIYIYRRLTVQEGD